MRTPIIDATRRSSPGAETSTTTSNSTSGLTHFGPFTFQNRLIQNCLRIASAHRLVDGTDARIAPESLNPGRPDGRHPCRRRPTPRRLGMGRRGALADGPGGAFDGRPGAGLVQPGQTLVTPEMGVVLPVPARRSQRPPRGMLLTPPGLSRRTRFGPVRRLRRGGGKDRRRHLVRRIRQGPRTSAVRHYPTSHFARLPVRVATLPGHGRRPTTGARMRPPRPSRSTLPKPS